MASTASETRKIYDLAGVTSSEQIRLVLPPESKKDESAVVTKTTPQEQPSLAQQLQSTPDTAMLDDLFSPAPAKRAPALASSSLNPPNPQALAGGGGGPGGVSTPNAGGGGSSGGDGGAGPGFTNSNQYLNNYLSMVGSALTPTATANTGTPTATAIAPPVPSFSNTATSPLSQTATPSPGQTTTTPAAVNHWTPPAATNVRPTIPGLTASGSDPLYVLDRNTGETLPANVPLNTFSTWNLDLLAQVSGATVSSYAWNTSQAPDLTNVSGQNTLELQGTWASFTGAAHTDIISVTETPTSGSPITLTFTYQVAGTDSPAYSSQPPTSSATWPTVVTPDQISSQQATEAGGPYASLGLADGSVQTSFAMPSYNPNVAPVSLDYNSTTANALPIFLVYYQLPTDQAVPATITASLTLNNGTPVQTVYDTSGLNPGDIVQIALQGNATALSTGRYPWQISVTNGSNQSNYSGNVDIVNQANSPYGAGWALDNVEQLVSVSGGVMLVNPDGTSLFFASNGQGGYTTPAGDFSTLVQNTDGSYTRTLTDGTQINFNSNGQQTSSVDRDGNTTTFGYTGGLLTSITDMNGQVTTLAYNNSGQLTSITDPANRTAALTYSGNQLTSITDPALDVWQYSYDSSNDLTLLTDPNNNTTTFSYNFADRVSGVTQADSTTEALTAEQMNGLAAPGTGTSDNPAPAVLLAAGDQAQFTDGNDNEWLTDLDWLGFGLDTLDADPLGDVSLTYRDGNGLAWLSSDPLGRATRDFFDNQGNITEEVAPDDTTQQYSYNQFGEVTQYTSQIDAVTSYSYNNKGDLTQMTDALGNITTYAYNNAGLVTSTTDPMGNTNTYAYNALNELTSTTDAMGDITSYSYDAASDLTSETDALGNTTTYSYDAMGRMTGATLPDTPGVFSTYTYTYDKVGNQLSVTDPLNHTTTYGYNAVNEQTSMTDPLGDTTTYGYDAAGNQTSVTDPLGNTTHYAYNAADQLVSVTDPMGDQTTYGYDAAGEQTSVTDPMGTETVYAYNARGEVTTTTVYAFMAGGIGGLGEQAPGAQKQAVVMAQTTYNYCGCGCCTGVTVYPIPIPIATQSSPVSPPPLPSPPPPLGETTSYSYNKLDELVSETDPEGNTTSYAYNADGDLTGVTNPLDQTTTYGYNALNEQTSVTDAAGDTTTYGYDAVGNQTSVTDPLGNVTSYTYDAQGRVLTETDPNGGVTTYTYDLAGNETSLTDPDGNTTSYTYDAANRLTASTNPMGYQSTYAYNAANELTSTTDADGRTIDYGYDAAGRETSETWVGGNYTATFAYNADSQLTSAQDPFSSYTYTYDALGDMTSVSNAGTPGVPTVTLSYSYDSLGNQSSLMGLTDSLGGSINYGYNADNQLSSIGLSVSGTLDAQVSFAYDEASNLSGLTRTAGAGSDTITTSYSYDQADRLTNITDTDATKDTTLDSYTYGYNAASELTSYQDNSGNSLTYGYDPAGQLTSALGTLAGSSYSAAYNYDANGNRTSVSTDVGGSLTTATYTTTTGNEMTSDGTYDYTYDHDGNMTSQTDLATGTVTYYTWDYENRLTEEKVENSQGQVLEDETFTYDVNNNRIAVSLNGTPQLYTVYDGSNAYMDFNGSGQLTERYLTNPQGLSQFYGQVSASGTTQWFLTDNLYSIRQVVDASGNPLYAVTYDPFGGIVSQMNAANAPRFGYAGGAYDSVTGTWQFGRREENPADGRWLSQDPLSFAAGDTNLYRYTGNDPTNAVDPSGELFWIPFIIGAIIVAGGTGGLYVAASQYDSASDLYALPPSPEMDALIAAKINSAEWWEAGGYTAVYTGGGLMAGAGLGYIGGYATGLGYGKTVGIVGGGFTAVGLAGTGYGTYKTPWRQLNGPGRLQAAGTLYGPWAGGFLGGKLSFRSGWAAGRTAPCPSPAGDYVPDPIMMKIAEGYGLGAQARASGPTAVHPLTDLGYYGPFHRSPEPNIAAIQQSGVLLGYPPRGFFYSTTATVQAYDGPLLPGQEGITFYTPVKPTWVPVFGGQWWWYGTPYSSEHSIPVVITGSK